MPSLDLTALLGVPHPRDAAILVVAALLGGLVRGFTGFGFAMAFVPLASLVVRPVTAVGIVWNLDMPFALPLAVRAAPHADWREVVPLLAGAVSLYPLGVFLLKHLDPLVTRWVIGILILTAVGALASGLRYQGRASIALSVAIGCLSGLTGGLSSLGGMPLAIFWLGSQHKSAAQTRRNLMAYLGLSSINSGIVLIWSGVVNWVTVHQAIVLIVPYGCGLLAGLFGFRFASERTFRQIAYLVIAASALLSLPLLDPWLR